MLEEARGLLVMVTLRWSRPCFPVPREERYKICRRKATTREPGGLPGGGDRKPSLSSSPWLQSSCRSHACPWARALF